MGDYDSRMTELLIAVGVIGAIAAACAFFGGWAIIKLLGH